MERLSTLASHLCANYVSDQIDQQHVLIVGGTGLVGRSCAEHFATQGWRVTTVSRRPLSFSLPGAHRHVPLDLTDEAACNAVLGSMAGVTHLIYTAIAGVSISDPEEIATNTSMLRNTLLPLEAGSHASLRHVSILQGRKAYAEYDPTQMLWPLKEDQPRHGGGMPVDGQSSWYFTQEDFVKARRAQPGVRWTYTIWRPPTVLGFVPGAPLNMIAALGVYAAVSRELGEPLRYPGGPPTVKQLCDSRLLARALRWAADESDDVAADEVFNVANSDLFLWQAAFPAIASCFDGLAVGEPCSVSLAETMPKHSLLWQRMVKKYGLQPMTMEELVGDSWRFTDINMQGLEGLTTQSAREQAAEARTTSLKELLVSDAQATSPILAGQLMSMSKLQLAGFSNAADTEELVVSWLRQMQEEGFLPR